MIPRCFQIHMAIARRFRCPTEGLIVLIEKIRGAAQLDKPWALGIARLLTGQRNYILIPGRQTCSPVQSAQFLRQKIRPLPGHHLPCKPRIVQDTGQGSNSGKITRSWVVIARLSE